MAEIQNGHPCIGKDCLECETCIFDEDLFLDKKKPNEKAKLNKNNNNNMNTCNKCIHLEKSYQYCPPGKFDACCGLVKYEAFGANRPRRIDYNLSSTEHIASPTWCPLKDEASRLMYQPSSTPAPVQPPTYLSASDKRERMKTLRKHVEWADIKEGTLYVIPKIMSQPKKVVKVITKTDMCCTCHEISEYTGNEYQCNTMIYPTDLDAVFITELRNF